MKIPYFKAHFLSLVRCGKLIEYGALALSLSMFSSQVFAWGAEGHQVIAKLAEGQLTVKARSQLARLLALEPGETLVSISTWADEHRSPATGRWHFVNFPRNSCEYDAQRECPDGKCVVGAINKQLNILASGVSDDQRLLALKYVVHFVGDVHQPLHAGYLDDKGGNTYQLQAFGRGSSLHALWDSGLIRQMDTGAGTFTARLQAKTIPAQARDLDVGHAAEESCRIVGAIGFYPPRKVGVEYLERFGPVVEQRLLLAGARLAGLLNGAFR